MINKIDQVFEKAVKQSDKMDKFLSPKEKNARRKEKTAEFIGPVTKVTAIFGTVCGVAAKLGGGLSTKGAIATGIAATAVTTTIAAASFYVTNFSSDKEYRQQAANSFRKEAEQITKNKLETEQQPTQETSLTTEEAFANSVTHICAEAIKNGETIDQHFIAKTKENLKIPSM